MRRSSVAAAVVLLIAGSPLDAQDDEGLPAGRVISDECYDPNFHVSDRQVQLIVPDIIEAMQKYVDKARTAGNLDDVFYGERETRRWSLDGAETDPRSAKDPWIGTSTRLQPVQYVRSNHGGGPILSRWMLIGRDGSIIGTYDAVMVTRDRHLAFQEMNLHSPDQEAALVPLNSFCLVPGDIEQWQADKARRQADKTAPDAESR